MAGRAAGRGCRPGVLLTAAGVVLTARSAGPLRVMADPAVRRRYSIIVGLEFGPLGAGAAVLGATGQDRWIPVWICAGVGAHFFPLASTLATGLASATAPSTVTGAGAGAGSCLLAFGLMTLLAGRPFTVIHPMAYVGLDLNRRGKHERTVG
jgi:hypothetical protein